MEKKRRKTIAFFYEHLMKKNGEDTYVPKKSSLSLKYKKKHRQTVVSTIFKNPPIFARAKHVGTPMETRAEFMKYWKLAQSPLCYFRDKDDFLGT